MNTRTRTRTGKLRLLPPVAPIPPHAPHAPHAPHSDLAALDSAASDVQLAVTMISERLRYVLDTADGLDLWIRTGERKGYHPSHAANRLRKAVREISPQLTATTTTTTPPAPSTDKETKRRRR